MNKKVMKLASNRRRLGAYCIDKIVPFVLLCVVVTVGARITTLAGNYYYRFGYINGSSGINLLGTAASVFVVMAVAVLYLVVQIFFFTKSQTIGKAALGLQVISSIDGKPVGVLKMILRELFAKKASGAVFFLGYLWVLIDAKNRSWHDKIMDTYVIDIAESNKYNLNKNNSEAQADGVVQDEAVHDDAEQAEVVKEETVQVESEQEDVVQVEAMQEDTIGGTSIE